MSVNDTLIALGVFIFWQIAAMFSVLFKDRNAKIPRRSIIVFLLCGSMLAVFRAWAFSYLSYRNRTHTNYASLRPLYFCLLPEGSFVGMLRMENTNLWLIVMYSALALGSFLWAFPLVLWLVPRNRLGSLREISRSGQARP